MSNIKHYLWSGINRIGLQIIGFVGNIFLVRQLTPEDYGLVAMLAIFMGIASNLIDSGFADGLIRKRKPDKQDYGTIFMYNVTLSLIIYVILFGLAPFIANFFQRNELIEIIRILGFSIIVRSLTITEFTRMRKELLFKRTTLIQLMSNLISILIAFLMAFNGFGYWALVFQTISIAVIDLFLIIIINKWRPYFFFSWRKYKRMRAFSNNLLLSYFFNQIGNNAYSFFIGKFYSANSLGFYNQGRRLNDSIFKGLNGVIVSTSYPILANEVDEEKRKNMYKVILSHFLFIQFGIALFLIGVSKPLIEFLYGNLWLQTASYFQFIVISFIFYPLVTINASIIKVIGKSKLYRNLTFLRNGLSLFFLIITVSYSIEIVLIGQIFARYISVIVDVLLCGKLIKFGFYEQFKIVINQIWSPIIALSVAFIGMSFFNILIVKIISYTTLFFLLFYILNYLSHNTSQLFFGKKLIYLKKNLINKQDDNI